MPRIAVATALCFLALPAAAQSIVDCTTLERNATPADLFENANYAVQLRDSRVRLLVRRIPNHASFVIDFVPHPRLSGTSYQLSIGSGINAQSAFWIAVVQRDGTILFEQYWGQDSTRGEQTHTRLTVLLRCPNDAASPPTTNTPN